LKPAILRRSIERSKRKATVAGAGVLSAPPEAGIRRKSAMFTAILLAIAQLPERGMRRPLLLTLFWSVVVLAVLWVAVGWGVAYETANSEWLRWGAGLLGVVGVPLITWFMFPSVVLLILGFYSDSIIEAVERRHYPRLPPAPPTRWHAVLWSGIRLALISILLNIGGLILGLLFLPSLPFLFFGLNGYLLGREYFNAVALRRLSDREADLLWQRHRMEFIFCGAAAAGLFLIPFVNLVAPMVGTAASVHLVERLRQSERVLATG
jgi:CysZ protein